MNFVNGELEGKASEYWQSYDKPVATGYYHQGRKEGKWDTDYKDTRGHIIFKNGNIIEKREWFLDEQIACSLTIGSTSESIKWYENGQKRSEQHWMSSEFNEYLEGSVTKWYENGKLESKGGIQMEAEQGNGAIGTKMVIRKAKVTFYQHQMMKIYRAFHAITKSVSGLIGGKMALNLKRVILKNCSKYGLEKKIGIWKGGQKMEDSNIRKNM